MHSKRKERIVTGHMAYRAVIFDLDGTLLDTLQDLTDAVNAALSSQGLPLRSREEVCAFVGNGIQKLLERAVPEGQGNPAFDKVFEVFREHYRVHCQDKTAPYEGILPLLRELKERGIRVGVVSNKADFAVQELIPFYFERLVSVAHGENEAAGILKKPAPDMVYQTLEELGCRASEAVYVGDSDVDLETAENSGLAVISVSWGFRGRAFLEEHGADRIVDSPEELIPLLL